MSITINHPTFFPHFAFHTHKRIRSTNPHHPYTTNLARTYEASRQNQPSSRIYAFDGKNTPSDDDDPPFDIDQLAAQLAAEAERLRRRQSSDTQPSFGYESKSREADALALSYVGDGGFFAGEFELLQELGSISIQRVEAPTEDTASPFSTQGEKTAKIAIVAYTANFFSGMPFQDPVVIFLKEYHPDARAIACNELVVLKHLCGIPDITDKWKVASYPLQSNPPIVQLLGYFQAGPSERTILSDPGLSQAAQDSDTDTLWVVSKWEGMAPLSLYPAAQQTSGFGLGKLFGSAERSLKERFKMLKAVTRGMVRSLGYCHDRGVIHGSVGSGSFLLSTYNDQDSARVVVKLDNFGFARRIVVPNSRSGGSDRQSTSSPTSAPFSLSSDNYDADTPFALGCRADQRQLAVVILETILSALSTQGSSQGQTKADSIVRLLGEVFDWDIEKYKRYCIDEPDWDVAVALLSLDDDAGWDLLGGLIKGNVPTSVYLEESLFLNI